MTRYQEWTYTILLTAVCCLVSLINGKAWTQDTDPSSKTAHAKPVEFVEYKETGDWTTWKDDQLSIRIPSTWSIKLAEDRKNSKEWTYALLDDSRVEVFQITVKDGGQEWIGCFCAPQSEYEYSERQPYKIWALTMDLAEGMTTRTVKVANKELRLDIHAMLFRAPKDGNEDRAAMRLTKSESDIRRYIAESARVNR